MNALLFTSDFFQRHLSQGVPALDLVWFGKTHLFCHVYLCVCVSIAEVEISRWLTSSDDLFTIDELEARWAAVSCLVSLKASSFSAYTRPSAEFSAS
jgi:hypothetical protein